MTAPRVLILDEPTSALERADTDALLRVLGVLRERRVAVVFVSHVLEEVLAVCDEVTVLRDGRAALAGVPRADLTTSAVVDAMLGDRASAPAAAGALAAAGAAGAEAAEAGAGAAESEAGVRLAAVSVAGRLEAVDLRAAPGEIVGLAGSRARVTRPSSRSSPAAAGRTPGACCSRAVGPCRAGRAGRSRPASRSSRATGGASASCSTSPCGTTSARSAPSRSPPTAL